MTLKLTEHIRRRLSLDSFLVEVTTEGTLAFLETYTFLVRFVEYIAISILSAYLYERWKSKKSKIEPKLKIEGIDVRIGKGKIERILIKRLEKFES